MQDRDLYARILGLTDPWRVVDLQLDSGGGEIRVKVEPRADARFACPECGKREGVDAQLGVATLRKDRWSDWLGVWATSHPARRVVRMVRRVAGARGVHLHARQRSQGAGWAEAPGHPSVPGDQGDQGSRGTKAPG
jgi:hypothetical protein